MPDVAYRPTLFCQAQPDLLLLKEDTAAYRLTLLCQAQPDLLLRLPINVMRDCAPTDAHKTLGAAQAQHEHACALRKHGTRNDR